MDRLAIVATVTAGGVAVLAVVATLSLLAGAVESPWLAVGFATAAVVGLACAYGADRAGRIRTAYW